MQSSFFHQNGRQMLENNVAKPSEIVRKAAVQIVKNLAISAEMQATRRAKKQMWTNRGRLLVAQHSHFVGSLNGVLPARNVQFLEDVVHVVLDG